MNLVMLTKYYPYGTGEAFIENEIPVLSKFYERVLIIACEAPETSVIRTVPANVMVRSIRGLDAKGKVLTAIKGQCNHFKNDAVFHKELEKCKTISQKAFLRYFEKKSLQAYRQIRTDELLAAFGKEPFVLYSYWLYMTARVATLIKEECSVAYMFSRTHGYDLYDERNRTNYLPYREMFLNAFDKVFPCSEDGAEYLKERYPQYREKIHSALLGTMDHGCGIASNDGIFRIVTCSRAEPVKRLEKMVAALKILDRSDANIAWIHIGDGSCLEKVKEMANTLKNIRCCFLGNVPNREVLRYYRENPVDLFVNVSSSEGLPVSIMEAISFGIPVVATDVGGTREIVIEGRTGHLLTHDPTDREIAESIEAYTRLSETKMLEMRKRDREYWEKHFEAENNYHLLYRQIEQGWKDRVI